MGDGDDVDAVATDSQRDAATPQAMPAPATPVVADSEPAAPRPLRRAPEPVDAARPLRVVSDETVTITPQPDQPDAAVTLLLDRIAVLEAKLGEVAALAPATDTLLADRVAVLEARLEEQDAALRRVLTLLVDWVESDGRRPDQAGTRPNAA